MTSFEYISTFASAAVPAILAQISAAPNQVMTVLYGGVSIMGAVYLAIMLFKALFPSRLPPIGEDLAKMATKVELKATQEHLEARIAADIAQHDVIKETIRKEVRDDMSAVKAEITTSLGGITQQIRENMARDEQRASNAHKRIDVLVQRVSEIVGKMDVIQGRVP